MPRRSRGLGGRAAAVGDAGGPRAADGLFEAGWRRSGFGDSDDELQFRERAIAALPRYHERDERQRLAAQLARAQFDFRIGPHHLRGRVDRVDAAARRRLRGDRLQDGRPEVRRASSPATCSSRSIGSRRGRRGSSRPAWAATGTCSPTRRSQSEAGPTTLERVERTVLEVARESRSRTSSPGPSHEICSWCDYRLICPASEA